MKRPSSLLFVLSCLLVVPAVACTAGGESGDDGVSDSEVNRAPIEPGSFRLYETPNANPSSFCDVHTAIDLTHDGVSRAELKEALSGECELFVEPNPRSYALSAGAGSCGSRVFIGRVARGGDVYTLKLTDHRTRVCNDVVPARVIVEETITRAGSTPRTTKLYSFDRAPATPAPGACRVGDKEYAAGERFPAPDGCNTCFCDEGGSVACTELFCLPK